MKARTTFFKFVGAPQAIQSEQGSKDLYRYCLFLSCGLISYFCLRLSFMNILLGYILSNKRNAPNIKLNHRFIFTLEDYMSVDVRYEYDEMFESTTKGCDH